MTNSTKNMIRQRILEKMKLLDTQTKSFLDNTLLQQLCASTQYAQAHVIATYMSMSHEFNTLAFIEQAQCDGKIVVIPRTLPSRAMEFHLYDPHKLRKSSFGIDEPESTSLFYPEDIDLIHVPALAINSRRYRIGYGDGYYDRYLENYLGDTISTIYPFQQCEFMPESFDIPVSTVVVSKLERIKSTH